MLLVSILLAAAAVCVMPGMAGSAASEDVAAGSSPAAAQGSAGEAGGAMAAGHDAQPPNPQNHRTASSCPGTDASDMLPTVWIMGGEGTAHQPSLVVEDGAGAWTRQVVSRRDVPLPFPNLHRLCINQS